MIKNVLGLIHSSQRNEVFSAGMRTPEKPATRRVPNSALQGESEHRKEAVVELPRLRSGAFNAGGHIPDASGGYVMLLTILVGSVFLTVLTGSIKLGMANYSAARSSYVGLSALAVAEAGGENALFNVNVMAATGNIYSGTTPPTESVCSIANSSTASAGAVTLFNDAVRGRGTYETCVVDSGGSGPKEKVVYALGKVYLPANSPRPAAVRRIRLILNGQPGGEYAVHSGSGGLYMSNSANITNGSVYTNGFITMENFSEIGTPSSPVGVVAANHACPKTAPYTNYPQRCPSGTQPINLSGQAHIYGTVQGNEQTDGTGMSDPGLVASTEIQPIALPSYDRAGQKSRINSSYTMSGDQSCSSGTLTLRPDTKIAGNLTISNSCTVLVQGDVWITGKVTLTQKGGFKADPALAAMPTVMIDGSSGINYNQQSSVSANSSGIGIQFITFWSAATCSPDCTSVTGADLVNSMNVSTINLNNQALAAGSRFYAYWSGLTMGQGGSIGSIAAQKINLNNSGSISFSSNQGTSIYVYRVQYYETMAVPDARNTN